MSLRSLLPSYNETSYGRPALFGRVGTPVIVGAAMAVVVGLGGLAVVNSRTSTSCENADGMVCDTKDVGTEIATPLTSVAIETTSTTSESDRTLSDGVLLVPAEPDSTNPDSLARATDSSKPADSTETMTESDHSDHSDHAPETAVVAPETNPSSVPDNPDPAVVTPAKPAVTTPSGPDPTVSSPANPKPATANFEDISTFGAFHQSSSHTHGDSLAGGRTAITTEAHVAYNDLRAFLGRDAVELEAIGRWAFANDLTNNAEAYEQDLRGVGLYYGMQGVKVGWIRDDAFDPQILVDVQRAARQNETSAVMAMVETFGHPGYADYLTQSGQVDAFVNTLKMEPHYGGWMHGRVHGGLPFNDGSGASVAIAHDLNHLTVLSHDQTQPFMNDTFDWPQWPALEVPESDVADYFQAMVVLGDPHGSGLS